MQLCGMDKKYKRIFSGAWARYAWGNFVTLTGDELLNAARDAIEKMSALPGMSETGKLLFSRSTLKFYRSTLRAVIQGIHELELNPNAQEGQDPKGDMNQTLLSKLPMSGTNGDFPHPAPTSSSSLWRWWTQAQPTYHRPGLRHAASSSPPFSRFRTGHPAGVQLPRQRPHPRAVEVPGRAGLLGASTMTNMVKIAILIFTCMAWRRPTSSSSRSTTPPPGYPGQQVTPAIFAGEDQNPEKYPAPRHQPGHPQHHAAASSGSSTTWPPVAGPVSSCPTGSCLAPPKPPGGCANNCSPSATCRPSSTCPRVCSSPTPAWAPPP